MPSTRMSSNTAALLASPDVATGEKDLDPKVITSEVNVKYRWQRAKNSRIYDSVIERRRDEVGGCLILFELLPLIINNAVQVV